MAPYELKGLTVKQLGEIRNAMSAPEYLLEIMKLPLEKQRESGLKQHQVQLSYLLMRDKELSDIRDKLVANETDLTNGITRVQEVLADLKKTEEILNAVTGFLKIVGKIIPLV